MQAANVEKAVEQLKSEGLDVDGMVRKLSSSDHCLIVGGTNKNDHHHQPSLNSYFALRSAMLGSRRTEALCWNPQSKGGHFDGKHSCSRYWILLNIICNSNHFQGGEVWTFWSPMQRSILTLDPHLDVLRRWENKHWETFMKIISLSSRLGTRYLRSM